MAGTQGPTTDGLSEVPLRLAPFKQWLRLGITLPFRQLGADGGRHVFGGTVSSLGSR